MINGQASNLGRMTTNRTDATLRLEDVGIIGLRQAVLPEPIFTGMSLGSLPVMVELPAFQPTKSYRLVTLGDSFDFFPAARTVHIPIIQECESIRYDQCGACPKDAPVRTTPLRRRRIDRRLMPRLSS